MWVRCVGKDSWAPPRPGHRVFFRMKVMLTRIVVSTKSIGLEVRGLHSIPIFGEPAVSLVFLG